ncbi:hypothetical protein QG061_01570 [Kingella kingae]|uniref:hypothetical protein n=1 Tax=Kingella kingae TaxID=504 RepID=UPI00254FCD66|nr:hypothetical protein [Kingella kingae]MDK4673663.1 hypothetical protein [Kingella kingae]
MKSISTNEQDNLIQAVYTPMFAMMHENYQDDSWLVQFNDLENIELRVFHLWICV